ncbi:hypothetical protein GTO27_12530 [Candidatus Bathyarchaeota archaeon]|nr:hypothetical protein [Candidatus Bathyarchaeota archaeon]
MRRWKNSPFVSLVAVFAAFSIVCDSLAGPFLDISGVWFSWIFIAEPINGIVLEPYTSFLSTLIGVIVGHSIYVRGAAEFLFTLGAPIGALISSHVFRSRCRLPLVFYLILLGAFFATPVSWQLPLWGMWDVYLAFGCLILSALIMKRSRGLWDTRSTGTPSKHIVALSTFIGLEADVLFRIFILVPCQTYKTIYALDASQLQAVWMLGAFETSIKAAISMLVSAMVTPHVITALQRAGLHLIKR